MHQELQPQLGPQDCRSLAGTGTPLRIRAACVAARFGHRRSVCHYPNHSPRASSAITSGISSGKNRFAPSIRRTPRERGKVRSSQSGPDGSKMVSPVPQTTRRGAWLRLSASSIASSGFRSSAMQYPWNCALRSGELATGTGSSRSPRGQVRGIGVAAPAEPRRQVRDCLVLELGDEDLIDEHPRARRGDHRPERGGGLSSCTSQLVRSRVRTRSG